MNSTYSTYIAPGPESEPRDVFWLVTDPAGPTLSWKCVGRLMPQLSNQEPSTSNQVTKSLREQHLSAESLRDFEERMHNDIYDVFRGIVK